MRRLVLALALLTLAAECPVIGTRQVRTYEPLLCDAPWDSTAWGYAVDVVSTTTCQALMTVSRGEPDSLGQYMTIFRQLPAEWVSRDTTIVYPLETGTGGFSVLAALRAGTTWLVLTDSLGRVDSVTVVVR